MLKFKDYEAAFSPARINRYLQACNGDTKTALKLYRYNIKLCQKFYGILNVFEVILRNAINEHYVSYYSNQDWIRNQLNKGGILENYPRRSSVEKCIDDLYKTNRYTNDRIVSSVSFGFWTHLFSRRPFSIGGQSLLKIFPARTKGMGQRAIYKELTAIKTFRNRIAHHEPICFDANGVKSTQIAKESYALVVKYVRFLGYPESHIIYGLDVLPDAILNKIDNM